MHGASIKLCAVLRAVRGIAASAETGKADRSAEERVSDPDWMPGMPRPEGTVPPEPPGQFSDGMHTHVDPAVEAVIAFLRRDYSIHLQPVTVRRLLDVVDRARLG